MTTEPSPLRVLIVDDNRWLLRQLERTLSELTASDITSAQSLQEAQSAIDANDFDLALLTATLQGAFTGPVAEQLTAADCPYVFVVDADSRGFDLRPYQSLARLTRPAGQQAVREVMRANGFLPRKPLVLILEDDTDLWFQWIEEFGKRNIDCTTANSIQSALRAIRHSRVDAVVTDMIIADIDGRPTVEGGERLILHLRDPSLADLPPWTREVPVVALTGSDPRIQALPLASRLGAEAVLRKPVPPELLVDAVEELLANPMSHQHEPPT